MLIQKLVMLKIPYFSTSESYTVLCMICMMYSVAVLYSLLFNLCFFFILFSLKYINKLSRIYDRNSHSNKVVTRLVTDSFYFIN